jgi:hypothetical protein
MWLERMSASDSGRNLPSVRDFISHVILIKMGGMETVMDQILLAHSIEIGRFDTLLEIPPPFSKHPNFFYTPPHLSKFNPFYEPLG